MKKTFLFMLVLIGCALHTTAQTDYTSRITNPTFSDGKTMSGWTYVKGTRAGDPGSYSNDDGTVHAMELYEKDFTLTQQLTDLPTGVYRVTFRAACRTANIVEVMVLAKAADGITDNEQTTWVPSGVGLSSTGADDLQKAANYMAENSDKQLVSVDIDVFDGTLTLGLRGKFVSKGWFVWNEVTLTRTGDVSQWQAMQSQAETFNSDNLPAAILANVQQAAALSESDENTVILGEAIATAQSCIQPYANYKSVVAKASADKASAQEEDAPILAQAIADADAAVNAATSSEGITDAATTLETERQAFVQTHDPVLNSPFDVTYTIANADFTADGENWTEGPSFKYGGAEVYNANKETSQIVTGLRSGTYRLTLQGAVRNATLNIQGVSEIDDQTSPNATASADTFRDNASSGNSDREKAIIYMTEHPTEGLVTTTVKVGPVGTLTVTIHADASSKKWAVWNEVRLEYLGRDAGDITLAVFDTYETIAAQATNRSAYDAVLTKAQSDLQTATTEDEINTIKETVRTALLNLISTGTTATGQFDLTSLLANPDFNSSYSGWTVSKAPTVSHGIVEVFNSTAFSISQTLTDMPAGTYTVQVQAFHRPQQSQASIDSYVMGDAATRATLSFCGDALALKHICADSRFDAGDASKELKAMPDGSAVPNTMTTAQQMFVKGQYWNVLRSDLTEQSDLTIGISLTEAAESNWLAFDNFHLFYSPKAQVDLDASVPAIPVYADVASSRTLKAGHLNAICLPYDADADDFGEVYELGDMREDGATLVPAREMKAGRAYMVKPASDIALCATDVLLSAVQPDTYPTLWDGTFSQANYTPQEVSNVYVLNAEGTAFEYVSTDTSMPACTPIFVTTDNMTATIPVQPTTEWNAMTFKADIENIQVHRYLTDTEYTAASASVVKSYNHTPSARNDQPRPVGIAIPAQTSTPTAQSVTIADDAAFTSGAYTTAMRPGATLWHFNNFTPGNTYYYKVEADGEVITQGQFTATGQLRMIALSTGSNIRDLGGWTTNDGSTVRYGLIYRGGEMHAGKQTTLSSDDVEELRRLGVAAELDLRETSDFASGEVNYSALGTEAPYYYFNQHLFEDDALRTYKQQYLDAFNFLTQNLENGQPTYFHCIWGADRTGAMAFLIEGLLGMSRSDIYKDYELTTFSKAGSRVKSGLDSKFAYIDTFDGTTDQERFFNYLNTFVGVSADVLHSLIGLMLERPAVVLDENADFDAGTQYHANVTLNRTINEGFNTLVLPFDLTQTDLAKFGSEAEAYTLTGETEQADGTYQLNFTKADGTIPTNTPMILKGASAGTAYTFDGVDVKSTTAVTTETDHFQFVGNYNAKGTVPEGNWFVRAADGNLVESVGNSIKSFRAYIAPKDGAAVKAALISFDGTTTGVRGIENGELKMENWAGAVYDISGRKVSDNSSFVICPSSFPKGIYVSNGHKFIVK